MYNRSVLLKNSIADGSFFIFGPRQSGKSTFLKAQFPRALYLDLLNSALFRELGTETSLLSNKIRAHLTHREAAPIVIIDEIQKLPELLDAVQEAMGALPEIRFFLTGSSSRKLRQGGRNLLGGRASWMAFHPITTEEVTTWNEKGHNWRDLIQRGGLPAILTAAHPQRKLRDYVDLYLREEIAQEGLVRNLPAFSRFLHIAGQTSGQQIVFEKVGSDCEMSGKTVRAWYDILQDTLIGFLLPCFAASAKRKAVSSAKFFLFDVGVANYLKGRSDLVEKTASWGEAFEHLVFTELRAYLDYTQTNLSLSYWRSVGGAEVDFVIHREDEALCLIEVKGKSTLSERELRGVRALAEEFPNVTKYVVTVGTGSQLTHDNIWIVSAEEFFQKLWSGSLWMETKKT